MMSSRTPIIGNGDDANINNLIAEFVRDWITPLEKLAQAIFFTPEFRKALNANTVEAFLRDSNHETIREAIKRAGIESPNFPLPIDGSYVVLHVLFKPIFDLLMKGSSVLWGGINYWDTIAGKFYTQQFTRPDNPPDDDKIFSRAMRWLLKEDFGHLLLPLTTFMFQNCEPPGLAAVFAKNEDLNHQGNLPKLAFYDVVGKVQFYDLRHKERVRQTITSDMDDYALTNILEVFFKNHRSKVSAMRTSAGSTKERINWKSEEARLANLFKFFDLITPDPGWNRLYYISARLKPNAQVAGLLLTAADEIDQRLITFVQFFISRVSSFIEYVISSHEMQRQAIRSALAAIMGRNMSHNIGSHVLARVSTPHTISEAIFSGDFLKQVKPFITPTSPRPAANSDPFSGKDEDTQINMRSVQPEVAASATLVAQLNAFLRMRMDFVADIATALKPPPPMRISFVGEVLMPFAAQLLLWKNLCGSQNLSHEDITFQVTTEGYSTILQAGSLLYPEKLDAKFASIGVGIPNGALGCQAFYSIVENFVRNSVKHSNGGNRKKIQVTFAFEANSPNPAYEDFFKITISDDWEACKNPKRPNLVETLAKMLKQPLINEDGSLLSSNRGLKEMKAAASYLRGLPPDSLEDPTLDPPLITVVEVEGGNLGYEFYLLKPKDLLVVDCAQTPVVGERVRRALRKQGVEIVRSMREAAEKALTYSILFVLNAEKSDVEDEVRKNAADMPVRIFLQKREHIVAFYGASTKVVSTHSVRTIYEHLLTSLREGRGVEASTALRELWMSMICQEQKTELWIDGNADTPEWNVAGISKLVSKTDKPDGDSQIILYSRHGFKHRASNVAFYEPYAGGGVDPIYFILDNPPQTPHAVRALSYQLIEAGALPVYIIDERIQEAASAVHRSFAYDLTHGESQDMIYWLRLMRVHIPTKQELDLEKEQLGRMELEGWLKATTQACQVGCKIPPVVVIHQGILDGVGLSLGKEAQKWMNKLKSQLKLADFIVTSGRGIPDNIPPEVRFVPLSTIALYTVERKSKFHLIKALMAARRAARTGGAK